MYGLNKKELKLLRKLNSPSKIQDFINKLKINFNEDGDTCMSPRKVLKTRKAHCIEGAFLAALCLRLQGYKPLVVDMKGTKDDWDHVIAIFKKHGCWGAISKSNHLAHRYREPVYRNIRELVMSIFHEYIDKKGRKTLRSFSLPVNLSRFDDKAWIIDEQDLWYIHDYLDKVKHFKILNRKQIVNLRKADKFEVRLGNMTEFKDKKN